MVCAIARLAPAEVRRLTSSVCRRAWQPRRAPPPPAKSKRVALCPQHG